MELGELLEAASDTNAVLLCNAQMEAYNEAGHPYRKDFEKGGLLQGPTAGMPKMISRDHGVFTITLGALFFWIFATAIIMPIQNPLTHPQ